MWRHVFVVFCLSFACQAFAQSKPEDNPEYQQALARYKECESRAPFLYHTEGRARLAATRSVEALKVLADDYGKTKNYAEYARYTLAELFGVNFQAQEAQPLLEKLRASNGKPVDTWLWVNLLRIQADSGNASAVVAIATEDRNPIHRAAAIAALGESKNGALHQAIVPNTLNFPKKDSDQAILIGAMSGALWERRTQVNDPSYREALKAYIGLLAPAVGLSHALQLQVARHLQWIVGAPALFKTPEPWLEILSRGDIQKPSGGGGQTVVGPRFFGIETEGERFVYLVDMSDSMCKRIDPSSKPGGPVTGPKQKKKKDILDESDLPWHQINTRWDLAREQLRISLSRLPDDKYFSIVWFGTDAGTLDSCKGMIRATRANVDRVMKELDEIKTGAADPVRSPDGVLRGNTNLHEGLRRAYALHEKGYAETNAYVDPGALTDGCDTIFLLSDGAPSCDGFGIDDKDYGEGNVVVDREYGAGAQRTPRLNYPGPYVSDQWLLADLRRMNAFRRIRMHCIGLGEANKELLKNLAEVGHGETFFFGQKKGK